VDPDVLYVDSGQLITSAGSAAGIDACLHLVARDFGTQVANSVARRLVMSPQRTGGQAQFIPTPVSPTPRNDLSRVMQWARERLHQPLEVRDLASEAAMSERTFLRRFSEASGQSPKAWLQHERLARARELLESTAQQRTDCRALWLPIGGKLSRGISQRGRGAAVGVSGAVWAWGQL
jgi:AraC family transcriptional activator FtrA